MSRAFSDCSSYGFERRAALYAGWDLQLRQKTRFFAAASLTNHVLAAAARMRFPRPLSRSAGALLDGLGGSLEKGNRWLAQRINEQGCSGIHLDQRMVEIEQGWVEQFLQRTAAAVPDTSRRVASQLDALLNAAAPWSLCDALFPSVRGYCQVLRSVRRQVGPPIRFSQQSHRVRIGQQLIACLRSEAISLSEETRSERRWASRNMI